MQSVGELAKLVNKVCGEGRFKEIVYSKCRYYGFTGSKEEERKWEEGEIPDCCKGVELIRLGRFDVGKCKCGQHFICQEISQAFDGSENSNYAIYEI